MRKLFLKDLFYNPFLLLTILLAKGPQRFTRISSGTATPQTSQAHTKWLGAVPSAWEGGVIVPPGVWPAPAKQGAEKVTVRTSNVIVLKLGWSLGIDICCKM